jgi:hypothetical protein
MEMPPGAALPGALPPGQSQPVVEAWAAAVAISYSLVLATGGGYVFYASVRSVSFSADFFPLSDLPWVLVLLVLGAAWVAGPVILLVLGLIHAFRQPRYRWRSAAGWMVALAAATAIGFLILHDFHLLFTAYPSDESGDPLGPSRWAPGGPYWPALAAAGGELAVGGILVALVSTRPGGFRLARNRARR